MGKTLPKGEDRILWTGEEVKGKSGKKKWNLFFFMSLFTLFFIAGSLVYVWSRIQVIQLGYKISNALKEERALSDANKKLKLEIATLKSYARIEKIAVGELKMAKPKPEQVIVIR